MNDSGGDGRRKLLEELRTIVRHIDDLRLLSITPLNDLEAIRQRPRTIKGDWADAKACQDFFTGLIESTIAILAAVPGRDAERMLRILELRLHNAYSLEPRRTVTDLARSWGISRTWAYDLEDKALGWMIAGLPKDAALLVAAAWLTVVDTERQPVTVRSGG